MSKEEEPYVPSNIECMVVQLEQATGVAPTIERVGAAWRMTHTGGDHGVEWTALLRPAKRGVRYVNRKVTVNGEHTRCKTWEAYYRLFKGEDTNSFEPVAIPEIEPMEGSDWRPTAVEALYRQVLHQCAKTEASVKVGRLKDSYVLDVRFSDAVLQIYFTKARGQWGIDTRDGILLVSPEGRDLTWEAGGDIQSALAILFGGTVQQERPTSTIGAPRSVPGIATSIQVRNTAVIRN